MGIAAVIAASRLYSAWKKRKPTHSRRPNSETSSHLVNSSDIDSLAHPTDESTASNSGGEETSLLNCLYAVAEDQARRYGVHHRGVTCNRCQSPIRGVRYKCANCVDYDVCEKCLTSCNHDDMHVFLRISIPVASFVNPRSPVMSRSLYQGVPNSYSRALLWDEVCHLQATTHFVQSEIESLFRQFCCLASSQGGIQRHDFNACLGPLGLEWNLIVERLFAFYDQDENGSIDFHEFCHGLSILTKGNLREKLRPAFDGYDLEKCGYVRRQDFRRMFKAYFYVTVELVREAVRACDEEMMERFEDDPSKPVSAMFNAPIPQRPSSSDDVSEPVGKPPVPPGTPGLIARRREIGVWPVLEAVSQEAIEELVDTVMVGADTDRDGRVSYEEFECYALLDPTVVAWLDALGPVF